ncbi:hypothetical protein TNCV_4208991 [Trichonephila clavipes]|nr:hypothetical protein TNCV_4208991 [Trichonephila clavipes]
MSVSWSVGASAFRMCIKKEYVTSSKETLVAESFLFGGRLDYHSDIGSCHPSCGELRSRRNYRCGNYVDPFSIG